jgi:hypothetical protein
MQVCLNGHQINSSAASLPHLNKKRCKKCGAETIMACPKCHTDIQGYHHVPGVLDARPVAVPAHCHNCGEPYPWTAKAANEQEANVPSTAVSKTIFIVHGHADDMKEASARALTTLGLEAIILHEQPDQGRTIIEKFEKHADVGFAVVLLSGDDMAYPAGKSPTDARPRARQNVIMELGYFYGKLGRGRVVESPCSSRPPTLSSLRISRASSTRSSIRRGSGGSPWPRSSQRPATTWTPTS